MQKIIIGLCGYPGSGKDAIAAHLVAKYGFTRVAFADPMRKALLALDPLIETDWDPDIGERYRPLSALIHEKGWDAAKRQYPDVREYLQRMGTEAGRSIHGPNCWLKLAATAIDQNAKVVVTDVRFENEVDMLRSREAKFVRVTRPGVGAVNGHESEKLDYSFAQYEIRNDGTLEDLAKSIEQLLGAIEPCVPLSSGCC